MRGVSPVPSIISRVSLRRRAAAAAAAAAGGGGGGTDPMVQQTPQPPCTPPALAAQGTGGITNIDMDSGGGAEGVVGEAGGFVAHYGADGSGSAVTASAARHAATAHAMRPASGVSVGGGATALSASSPQPRDSTASAGGGGGGGSPDPDAEGSPLARSSPVVSYPVPAAGVTLLTPRPTLMAPLSPAQGPGPQAAQGHSGDVESPLPGASFVQHGDCNF